MSSASHPRRHCGCITRAYVDVTVTREDIVTSSPSHVQTLESPEKTLWLCCLPFWLLGSAVVKGTLLRFPYDFWLKVFPCQCGLTNVYSYFKTGAPKAVYL